MLFVAGRAFLDEGEQLLRDQRLVRRLGAPDPLLAWPDERTAAPLVVPAPDVEAGVLRVAEHGLDLRATPGRTEVVLVLLVSRRRRVAVEITVELLADRAEAEAVDAVVLEDHPHDRSADRIGDEPVLAFPLARLVRVGMRVGLEPVAVRNGAAGVPALADALLHAAAALLDQVADVPLGDALLDPASEDGCRVGDHRFVRREQTDVELFEVALDTGCVRGHAREPVDALDEHRVERAIARGMKQIVDTAVAWHRDSEAFAGHAVAARVQALAPTLDVPVAGDELATAFANHALASGKLARDRERGVLGVLGRDAPVKGEPHRDLLVVVGHRLDMEPENRGKRKSPLTPPSGPRPGGRLPAAGGEGRPGVGAPGALRRQRLWRA
ncbi:MAG TPA: hypothetical protein VFA44_11575 [Gaiellaceae bacterium]|nr:hypothetical protein [Gaiellaceae bacterium]